MAAADFRFKKNNAMILDQLQTLIPNAVTPTLVDDAGGNIITLNFDDAEETDVVDALAELGYTLIEGTGGAGVTGVASDDEERRLLNAKNAVRTCSGGVDLVAGGWTPAGSGRGKTLTSPSTALSNNDHDGVTMVVGDRILVKDGSGANATSNGIYVMTQAADGVSATAIFTRAFDYDDNVEVQPGSNTFVLEGTTCERRTFYMTTQGAITVDTTQLVFQQSSTAIEATDSFIWGAGNIGSSTTDRFLFPGYSDSTAQTQTVQFRVPRAGTFQNMRVRHNDLGASANTVDYTLRVNGTPSILTVNLAANAADGNDLSNQVVVAAGDLIDIIVEKAASIGAGLRDIIVSVEFAA